MRIAEGIREVASAPMLPFERREHDEAVGRLREGLSAATLDAEWAAGRRLTIDEAVAFALDQSRS